MSVIASINDYENTPFDTASISRARLDVSDSGRRLNALPWRGQFTPDFIAALFEAFPPNGLVLDPFCGSGTSLAEAARLGLPAHGVEVNPSAYILARLYSLCSAPRVAREEVLRRLRLRLHQFDLATPSAKILADWITSLENPFESIVMEAVFLLALGNGIRTDEQKLARVFNQVAELIQNLPLFPMRVSIELGDARAIDLPDHSVDTLITSPPYVNVFNYHQNYRAATELLGWDVLPAARAEFGSNRKFRQNRFLTVIQYAQDIGIALQESNRTVRPDGTSIWIVGRESSVRGSSIPNPEIIYSMAREAAGLNLVGKFERKFRSRFGQLVFEDVLVFRHPTREFRDKIPSAEVIGREVGVRVLDQLKHDADTESEISQAINAADGVHPSNQPRHVRVVPSVDGRLVSRIVSENTVSGG